MLTCIVDGFGYTTFLQKKLNRETQQYFFWNSGACILSVLRQGKHPPPAHLFNQKHVLNKKTSRVSHKKLILYDVSLDEWLRQFWSSKGACQSSPMVNTLGDKTLKSHSLVFRGNAKRFPLSIVSWCVSEVRNHREGRLKKQLIQVFLHV
jgi:hypothetical protein